MDELKYFLSTVHRAGGTFTKNVTIHDTRDAALQGMYNEFTAWAFGKQDSCDYVFAVIHDSNGGVVRQPEIWQKATEE